MFSKNIHEFIVMVKYWQVSHKSEEEFHKAVNKRFIIVDREKVDKVYATSKKGATFNEF